MITAGLGILKLPPAAFWAMTPRELGAALRCLPGLSRVQAVPTLSDLDRLMSRFPDHA